MSETEYVKMDVWAVADADADEGFRLMLIPPERRYWMQEEDVKIGTETVAFNPPENMSREEMALKAIETLRERQQQIQAQAQRNIMRLQKRIDGLLLLTHDSSPRPEPTHLKVVNGGLDDDSDEIPF